MAAPIEGRTARRWLGVGIVGAVLAMCCGVGGIAVGGVIVTAVPAMNEQAQRAVGDYLDALVDGDWEEAYELRCDADREAESAAEFERRVSAPPRIDSYELGELDLSGTQQDVLELPVDLVYDDGRREQRSYPLAADGGALRVCRHAG